MRSGWTNDSLEIWGNRVFIISKVNLMLLSPHKSGTLILVITSNWSARDCHLILINKGIYMKLFDRMSEKVLDNSSNSRAYSEPYQTSKMENFCENS